MINLTEILIYSDIIYACCFNIRKQRSIIREFALVIHTCFSLMQNKENEKRLVMNDAKRVDE